MVNYKNGDKYQGSFKDGRPNGLGTMTYIGSLPGSQQMTEFDEAKYEGAWKAGKREGYGVLTWADGTEFRGIWKGDLRWDGELVMANGTVYRGVFSDDKMHGAGRLLLPSGVVF